MTDDIPDSTDRLESLAGLTQDFDQDNPTPQQAQAQAQQAQAAQLADEGARDWGMVMFTVGGLVCMVAPELHPIYSEDRCLTWGKHMHQVSEKYNWGSPKNAPELALVAASVSFVVPTYLVINAKVQEAKAAKKSVWAGLFYWWKRRTGATKTPEKAEDGGAHGVES